jgi:hypothetical protein
MRFGEIYAGDFFQYEGKTFQKDEPVKATNIETLERREFDDKQIVTLYRSMPEPQNNPNLVWQ